MNGDPDEDGIRVPANTWTAASKDFASSGLDYTGDRTDPGSPSRVLPVPPYGKGPESPVPLLIKRKRKDGAP
jgi:hypothetical protein